MWVLRITTKVSQAPREGQNKSRCELSVDASSRGEGASDSRDVASMRISETDDNQASTKATPKRIRLGSYQPRVQAIVHLG